MFLHSAVGYEICPDGQLEDGFGKIAIHLKDDGPSHAAKQLPSGRWTSKLGKFVDLEHGTPQELEGPDPAYGQVATYVRRRIGG